LYAAKSQTAVQADVQVAGVSALSSWFLPICGVFSLAVGMGIFGMRRRRAARSTRTIEPQAAHFSSDASDEEPFLSLDQAEV